MMIAQSSFHVVEVEEVKVKVDGHVASRRKGRHIILTTEHLKEELLLLSFPVPFIQSVILCRGVSAVATIRIYSQMADEEPQQSYIYADHDGDASQTWFKSFIYPQW